jgi:hypothetical protein
MDQSPRVRDAAEEDPPQVGPSTVPVPGAGTVPTDEEIAALRETRDALEAEQQAAMQAAADDLIDEEARRTEVATLRRQVADLIRQRDGSAGATPAPRPRPSQLLSERSANRDTPVSGYSEIGPGESASQASVNTHAQGAKRKRFRDPKPYKGENLKEATMFLKSLETRFKIDKRSFETDEDKVLYASTCLTDKPAELWVEGGDDDMTWDEFESFVNDCIADPVNRSLDVGQDYEDARQKEGESVSSFAMHLSTLESQFHDSYTEEQRTRHLFNKLRNNIREALSLKADIPINRKELVAMASRLENAQRPRKQHRSITDERRGRDAGGAKKQNGRKDGPSQQTSNSQPNDNKSSRAPYEGRKMTCYNCGKEGHKSQDCRSPPKNGSTPHVTRKVGVTDAPDASMAPPPRKSLKKGRGQAAGARFSLT